MYLHLHSLSKPGKVNHFNVGAVDLAEGGVHGHHGREGISSHGQGFCCAKHKTEIVEHSHQWYLRSLLKMPSGEDTRPPASQMRGSMDRQDLLRKLFELVLLWWIWTTGLMFCEVLGESLMGTIPDINCLKKGDRLTCKSFKNFFFKKGHIVWLASARTLSCATNYVRRARLY